jgi:hypothetical protein
MEEIGKQLGVCRRTILRWLADPALQPEIARRKRIREERFARNVRRNFSAIRAQMERERKERIVTAHNRCAEFLEFRAPEGHWAEGPRAKTFTSSAQPNGFARQQSRAKLRLSLPYWL